jgi:hypothetical protein
MNGREDGVFHHVLALVIAQQMLSASTITSSFMGLTEAQGPDRLRTRPGPHSVASVRGPRIREVASRSGTARGGQRLGAKQPKSRGFVLTATRCTVTMAIETGERRFKTNRRTRRRTTKKDSNSRLQIGECQSANRAQFPTEMHPREVRSPIRAPTSCGSRAGYRQPLERTFGLAARAARGGSAATHGALQHFSFECSRRRHRSGNASRTLDSIGWEQCTSVARSQMGPARESALARGAGPRLPVADESSSGEVVQRNMSGPGSSVRSLPVRWIDPWSGRQGFRRNSGSESSGLERGRIERQRTDFLTSHHSRSKAVPTQDRYPAIAAAKKPASICQVIPNLRVRRCRPSRRPHDGQPACEKG